MKHIITGKNAVKFLINTVPFLEGDLYSGIMNGTLLVKEFYAGSRNVVLLVYPNNLKKEIYYVIKQVQKADDSKKRSLQNEAEFISNNNFFEINFLDFDNENNILVYECNQELTVLNNREFENLDFGKSLAVVLSYFHTSASWSSSVYKPKKSLQIIDNLEVYLERLKNTNDLTILECIKFINSKIKTFEEIKKRFDSNELPNCLVHGDIKLSNLYRNYTSKVPYLVLLDFEMVGIANPVYDIASFIYNYYRFINDWGNNGLDPFLNSDQIKVTILKMINEYAILKEIDYKILLKDSFSIFYVKLLENYLNGSFNNVWDYNQQEQEYFRVKAFKQIINEYATLDFNSLLI